MVVLGTSSVFGQGLKNRCLEMKDPARRQACLKKAREIKQDRIQSVPNSTIDSGTYYPASTGFDMESLGTFSKGPTKKNTGEPQIKIDTTKNRFDVIQSKFEEIGIGLLNFTPPKSLGHILKISKVLLDDKSFLGFDKGQIMLLETSGSTIIIGKDLIYKKENVSKIFDFLSKFKQIIIDSLIELKGQEDYFNSLLKVFEEIARYNKPWVNFTKEKETLKTNVTFLQSENTDGTVTLNWEIHLEK